MSVPFVRLRPSVSVSVGLYVFLFAADGATADLEKNIVYFQQVCIRCG